AYSECWVTRARKAAQDADLVVVNHHLYFADLALRTQTDAELLPAYEAIVFDEAHNLEETASSYFGVQVSNFRFADLVSDVEKHLGRDGALTSEVTSAKNAVTDRYRELFGLISRGLEGDGARVEAEQVFDGPLGPEIQEAL